MADEKLSNILTGGETSVLDLIETVQGAIKVENDKELMESFLPKILPETYYNATSKTEQDRIRLNMSIMKICYRISKLGKDVKYLFETLDQDKGGSLEV